MENKTGSNVLHAVHVCCTNSRIVSALFLDDFQLDVYILMVRWVHNITLHFCTEMRVYSLIAQDPFQKIVVISEK